MSTFPCQFFWYVFIMFFQLYIINVLEVCVRVVEGHLHYCSLLVCFYFLNDFFLILITRLMNHCIRSIEHEERWIDNNCETEATSLPNNLNSWIELKALVTPITGDFIKPRVVLNHFQESSADHGRHISLNSAEGWLLKQNATHVAESQRCRPLESQ